MIYLIYFFKNISKVFLNVITIHCYDVFDVSIGWSQESWLKYCHVLINQDWMILF